MKRKNIIIVLLIICLVVIKYFTINYINNNSKSFDSELPKMDESMVTPPDKPKEDTKTESNINPDENENSNNLELPEKKDNNGMPPDGFNKSRFSNTNYLILIGEDIFISLLVVYLFMSLFNKKTFKETLKNMDKKMIYLLLVIILTIGLKYIDNYLLNNKIENNISRIQNKNVTASGNKEITSNETLTSNYDSTTTDESVILVKDGGVLTLKDAIISKSGDSSNVQNSEFYGINAGILVTKNSKANISNINITTIAHGSNAVFATGENSKIYINDSEITTTAESSARGLDATYGGYIEADNVKITTSGNSCATLATDRGEGTIITKNSTLETNGSGSPIIYSTGNISISNTKGIANNSQMVVVEGKNSVTISNSNLLASAKGNRNDVDNAGIMLYQSMSGDASEGTASFTSTDSTLTISSDSNYYKSAPMFFITNTDAVVNLESTTLEYGSNILISIKGTSEWGKNENNGGNLEFNATSQTLEGNIEVDNISALEFYLNDSSYKGVINANNKAKNIKLKLDSKSKITLTGDSYITELESDDTSYSNINFNGYKLYVNGESIN